MVIRIFTAIVRRKEDRTRLHTDIWRLKARHLSARVGIGIEVLVVLMSWVHHPDMNRGTRKKPRPIHRENSSAIRDNGDDRMYKRRRRWMRRLNRLYVEVLGQNRHACALHPGSPDLQEKNAGNREREGCEITGVADDRT